MGNRQEELESIVQQENYDIAAMMETRWDDSYSWSAAMDGYKGPFWLTMLLICIKDATNDRNDISQAAK